LCPFKIPPVRGSVPLAVKSMRSPAQTRETQLLFKVKSISPSQRPTVFGEFKGLKGVKILPEAVNFFFYYVLYLLF
jgi:hypothetical protein